MNERLEQLKKDLEILGFRFIASSEFGIAIHHHDFLEGYANTMREAVLCAQWYYQGLKDGRDA